ncbi:hypothetical protein [Sanguibacter sp. 25GB23B1]|uniref:hypothetical protein n=1 Tax=unclassified Sanguibacter TaxID=2645534 RepID=UPI0032AF75F7
MTPLQIALLGISATILGAAITVWVTRKYGNRRGRLLFTWEVLPLLEQESSEELLEVHYKDFPVPKAHLVTLQLVNIGSVDISSDRFDAGAGLAVGLAGCTFYGALRSSHPNYVMFQAVGTVSATVSFLPSLLKKGQSREVTLVVANAPDVEILRDPLVNVDIVERSGADVLASVIRQTAEATLPFGLGHLLHTARDAIGRR